MTKTEEFFSQAVAVLPSIFPVPSGDHVGDEYYDESDDNSYPDDDVNEDNDKDKDDNNGKQKGEDGNPPGITTPREDDDGYPDLPTPPPRGRFSLKAQIIIKDRMSCLFFKNNASIKEQIIMKYNLQAWEGTHNSR